MTVSSADPGDELVDVVDEDDRVVATVCRRQMRAERLRHRATFVAVTSSDGRLLVHRRSESKDLWPGRWDLAIGGVVTAGESYAAAALRELAEEIGVRAVLREIGKGRFADADVDLVAGLYHVVHDGPFVFVDGEVAEARLVTAVELQQLLASESFVPDSLALLPLHSLLDGANYDPAVYELEFTVEPFVEGAPGPHVRAAVDAATATGAEVDFGPFGSTCRATAAEVPTLVAAVTAAALANGATHVHLHIAAATS